jgi:hypothetical protein
MNNHPLFVQSHDTVYHAARLLYQHKVTGLLIMEQGRLAGSSNFNFGRSAQNVHGAFGPVAEECAPGPGLASRLGLPGGDTGADPGSGGQGRQHCLLSSEAARRIYSFRLELITLTAITTALKAAGHDVLA